MWSVSSHIHWHRHESLRKVQSCWTPMECHLSLVCSGEQCCAKATAFIFTPVENMVDTLVTEMSLPQCFGIVEIVVMSKDVAADEMPYCLNGLCWSDQWKQICHIGWTMEATLLLYSDVDSLAFSASISNMIIFDFSWFHAGTIVFCGTLIMAFRPVWPSMLWHLRSEDESVGESRGLYLSTSPQQPEGLTDRLLHFESLTILLISASACSGDQCHNFVATVGPFTCGPKLCLWQALRRLE